MNPLKNIIPVPVEAVPDDGLLPVESIRGYRLAGECAFLRPELERMAHAFRFDWQDAPAGPAICFRQSPDLAAEEWRMTIAPDGIQASVGDRRAACYALDALAQMMMTAMLDGPRQAALACGRIADRPRFAWRGLLLDSARHFQRPEMVKEVIRLLARWRMNVLHWHLIDNQGFRVPSRTLSRMTAKGVLSDGQYSREEIADIVACADNLGVRIVPEFDMPGHSHAFLSAYPECACDPQNPRSEICLGNPRSMALLKDFLDEMMALFPSSDIIHLGGDEADSTGWDTCPKCQAAMQARGFDDIRRLEHDFMAQMADFIIARGRRPMVWTVPCAIPLGLDFRPEVMTQVWQNASEPIHYAAHGNPIVFSLHYSLYLDYPRNFSETSETWMFSLDDKGIYLCDPHYIWADKVKDKLLGTESCLWTETVPEWRTLQKLMPRFPAYMECAWSRPEAKDWYDFCRRKELLEAAGYFDYVRDSLRECGD